MSKLSPDELREILSVPAVYVDRIIYQRYDHHMRLTFGESNQAGDVQSRISVMVSIATAEALRDLLTGTLGLPAEHKPDPDQVN